jgi:hypothetical protein
MAGAGFLPRWRHSESGRRRCNAPQKPRFSQLMIACASLDEYDRGLQGQSLLLEQRR